MQSSKTWPASYIWQGGPFRVACDTIHIFHRPQERFSPKVQQSKHAITWHCHRWHLLSWEIGHCNVFFLLLANYALDLPPPQCGRSRWGICLYCLGEGQG